MFDIGWSEIMVIIAVAVIVVGPKDIPKMLRTVGKYLRKAKSMVRDVQSQIEEVADISELKELKAEADKLKNFDLESTIDSFDNTAEMTSLDVEPSKAKEAVKKPKKTATRAKTTASKSKKIVKKTNPKKSKSKSTNS